MPSSSSIYVYLGTGEAGRELEAKIEQEALKRGFVKRGDIGNVSAFALYAIHYTIEHDKSKGKRS